MLLADIFSIALSIIGFLLSLQGLWMISRALWPARVANACQRVHRNSTASFLLGLLIIFLVIILAIVTAKRGGAPGQFFAFALGSAFVVYANVGVAGLATHIGQRLPSPADSQRPGAPPCAAAWRLNWHILSRLWGGSDCCRFR